jgi:hypothetical protein
VRLDVLANEKAGTHVSKNKVTFTRQVPWERRSVFFTRADHAKDKTELNHNT